MSIYSRLQIYSNIHSKYYSYYINLCKKSSEKFNSLEEAINLYGYVEKHHIIPRSLNSEFIKTPENIVYFSAREHFIAHRLLSKFTIGVWKYKMLHAVAMFSTYKDKRCLNSRQIEICRKNNAIATSIIHTGKKLSDETKAKIGKYHKGKIVSDETKQKLSKSKKGKSNPKSKNPYSHSDETKAKISKAAKNRSDETKAKISKVHKGKVLSEETKAKMRESHKNISEETKAKMSISAKKRIRIKLTCPYCGKQLSPNTYSRYHGDNCKHKQST